MWDLYVLLITFIDFDFEIDKISNVYYYYTHNFKLTGRVYITQSHDRRENATRL